MNTKNIIIVGLSCILFMSLITNYIFLEKIKVFSEPNYTETEISSSETKETEEIEETGLAVYISPSGKKYHRKNCRYLNKKTLRSINRNIAKARGYSPCSVCHP